ncbi:pathogenesis-related protein PRB1-3-like [Syzygium oleosum]|uniref:pathogenesis-related protein PRB1-3-like n=1 Tax=Syzygium oleosum TaxID=219896 RepID=UPI0011D27DB0|nr:pathogenesis-related protein PRB1-3-like [Syzygium oleosum]
MATIPFFSSLIFVLTFSSVLVLSGADATLTTAPRRTTRVSSALAITQYISSHNAVRAKHNLPALQWNTSLANFAKWYANQRRGDCALIHSTSDYGENIFWGQGKRWTPKDAVAAWAAVEAYFNYNSNTCMAGKDCSHYTQLVWRTTQKVGCAQIVCNSGDTFITCEYSPHGNVIGERPY